MQNFYYFSMVLIALNLAPIRLLADELKTDNLSNEFKVIEWLPTKHSSLNFTYSPICRSNSLNSQKRVRLLKDTKFLFGNFKEGDILFGVASFYQAKTYSIYSTSYCKPVNVTSDSMSNFESCLYDFNNDGFFDDKSGMPGRFTKAPEDDFKNSKHQYPYEVVDFPQQTETLTTCVTEDDKTWTASDKPNDRAKKIKIQEAVSSLMTRYEVAKEKGVLTCNEEKLCKKYFQLTQIFINNNSDMKIQVATDTIIETYNPTELSKIGIKASKYPGKDDSEKIVIDVICKGEVSNTECIEKSITIYEKLHPFINASLQ